jgi:RimJ/RimL family protein N-acetyltransferase
MVGISLQAEHRGRGLGTEAQRMLVGVLLRGLPVNRVEAWTDVENLAEQRSLEKAGFVREGVLRGAQWRRGAFHDLVAFSVLRSEWRDW